MISDFVNPVNPQTDCPLFNKIPREIRDSIFDLVMTPLEEEYYGHGKRSKYRGPKILSTNFRNLSTTVLRCCQLIYFEIWGLPAKKSIQHYPIPIEDDDHFDAYFPTGMQNFVIGFITRRYCYRYEALDGWHNSLREVARNAPDLKYLRINVPLDMLWNWGFVYVVTYPKEKLKDMEDSDCCHENWWGHCFQAFWCLAVMELKLESREGQKEELDLLVEKAARWRFPLFEGKELVFKSQKTKWEWWYEPILRES